jgi:hypothetical protein
MKKYIMALAVLALSSCIRQTIHIESSFFDRYTFEEVWAAAVKSVNDINFTVDSMDKEAGFISAESGSHIGQEVPPRLSIMIDESRGRVFVNCKVLQKEQFVDVFGHGQRTVRKFFAALNMNLNR